MKEFIEKLIGRLEEEKYTREEKFLYDTRMQENMSSYNNGLNMAIRTVNELAEEYKDKSNNSWKEIYEKVCNREKKYAKVDGDMENVNYCIRLQNLLQYFKEELRSEEENNNGWIPCSVIDHPEHCHDCEVTIKDVYGYSRDIAYYTDKWRRLSDETPVLVVAWKEPSAPYRQKEDD